MSWFRRAEPPVPVVRRVDQATPAVCRNCNGASGHPVIAGDGGQTCVACVWRLGRVVRAPLDADPGVVAMLAEAHGDVCWTGSCVEHRLCWRWKTGPDWPEAGESDLDESVKRRLLAMFGPGAA